MSSRIMVMGTSASPANAQVIHEISPLLSDRAGGAGSLVEVDALAGLPLSAVVADPVEALPRVVQIIRGETAPAVLIVGMDAAPAPSFDVLGWNLSVAANSGAQVVAVVDATGMGPDLVQAELAALSRRAQDANATLGGVVLIGGPGSQLREEAAGGELVLEELPLDADKVAALTAQPVTALTPLMFQDDLLARARSNRQRIVLPEPEDDRVLEAAAALLAGEVADIILIGEKAKVEARAADLGVDVSGASILSPQDPALVEKYAAEFARLRQAKGVTLEQAREKVQDVTYFATMMVQMGDADGMVSGAIHTTAETIVPAFQIIKTAPGVSLVSSAFLMLLKDHVLVMGDCAVNPNPTPDQLAEIAISSAQTAKQFGLDPKVAMLSYSTGSSGAGADVEAVTAATARVQEIDPNLPVEGPIQYDAAVDPKVGAAKAPNSQVAGQANVLIYPTLNAGNIAYKAIQRSAGAIAVGPILQGLRRPVNDLSRGALVEDIVNTVAITAVQAQAEGNN